jgi:oligopeptide transport system substrate-binding protein
VATVEEFGDHWTEPENIVSNGPFELDSWEHNSTIDLVKNDAWRDAANVSLTRVDGQIIVDGTTRVQAFEAGEVDALDAGGLPPDEIGRLKETPEYEVYPALGTYYYGFNLENIPDVHERRALSLAVDRRTIVDQIAQADQVPSTGFSPGGLPGFDSFNPKSPYTPESGDIEAAKAELAQASNPKTDLTIFFNDSPGHKEIATAVQSEWAELGIKTTLKQQEWAQFLESSARRRTARSTSTAAAGSATTSTRSTSSSSGRAIRATTTRTTATRNTTPSSRRRVRLKMTRLATRSTPSSSRSSSARTERCR